MNILNGISIYKRSRHTDNRRSPSHWECDLVAEKLSYRHTRIPKITLYPHSRFTRQTLGRVTELSYRLGKTLKFKTPGDIIEKAVGAG